MAKTNFMILDKIHEESYMVSIKGALYRILCGVNRLGDSGVKAV